MAMPADQIQVSDMFTLADRLRDLKNRKRELEDQVKIVNDQIRETEQALAGLMIEEEIQNFSRGDNTFYLTTETYAHAVPERKFELFAWLKENGYGDLVQETVNANSLSAFVRELLEDTDELPEGLKNLVSVYERTTVGMRKASVKNKKEMN